MSDTRFIVTNAPEAYDYDTAKTVETVKGSVRLVQITTERDPDYIAGYQAARYQSGLYFAHVRDTAAEALGALI